MSEKHVSVLEELYTEAEKQLKGSNNAPVIPAGLPKNIVLDIDLITEKVEYFLGINNVLLTSLTEKIIHPSQDIRFHQAKMKGGYSGRTLDTKYVAPFLKSKHLKSMVESGWLTRSLEQDFPYDINYRGAIRNKNIKRAFLEIIDYIQTKKLDPEKCLLFYLQKLILFREKEKIKIHPFKNGCKLSIIEICHLLSEHFTQSKTYGKAKLPVIAIYSIYECLINELKRFEGKTLTPLGYHTSADYRSKAVGDIQVNDKNKEPYEGVEIKHDKAITKQMIEDVYEKIKRHPISRYYILSTKDIEEDEWPKIQRAIDRIESEHGCQIIVNGIINSIKYYLRLIENPEEFIKNYTSNVVADSELKIEHKKIWKQLIDGQGLKGN
jgi:DNA (cytosine-5)-methyltransferase 1